MPEILNTFVSVILYNTLITPRYIPIPHIKATGPGEVGAVKVNVEEFPIVTTFCILSLGIVNDWVQL
jgi:hypothetical protein